MIDISQVVSALIEQLGTAIYPEGVGSPPVNKSSTRLYAGWPNAKALDEDLALGIVNVSAFPRAGLGQITSRYNKEWSHDEIPTPTLRAKVIGRVVTFTGVGSDGLLAGIIEGEQSWALKVMEGWAPAKVASAFHRIVRPGVVLDGDSLIFSGTSRLEARTAAAVPEEREVRRQRRGIQLTVWAPTPEARDLTFQILDLWVATHPFFDVENRAVRLEYSGDTFDEDARQANLHRRDMLLTVEYPTIEKRDSPPVVIPQVNIVVNPGGSVIRTIYP